MSLSLKFFAGSQVSSAKKWIKKKFGELSTEEIQEIVDNAVLVTTKIATRIGTDQFSFP